MKDLHIFSQFGVDGHASPRTWPVMTEADRKSLLPFYPILSDATHISHHSPRPFSSACIFSGPSGRYFIKRHDCRVKDETSLLEEHYLVHWLANKSFHVEQHLENVEGKTVTRCDDWIYELAYASPENDLYHNVQSWEGWKTPAQAHAAGDALAQLHILLKDFDAPPRVSPQLVSNMEILRHDNFPSALDNALGHLSSPQDNLRHHPLYVEAREVFVGFHQKLQPLLSYHKPCWGHGDWHGSNLMWRGVGDDAKPVSIFDFGMADRSSILFDLAVAIERSMVTWLAPEMDQWQVRYAALEAFLTGYVAQHPLCRGALRALAAILPLCHIHFALSEYRYYAKLLHDKYSAKAAFETYFIGHACWFQTAPGQALLRYIEGDAKPSDEL